MPKAAKKTPQKAKVVAPAILVNPQSGASYRFTAVGQKGTSEEVEINFVDARWDHSVTVPRPEAEELWQALVAKGYKRA